jgi:putative intracellular protease/amidase
MLRGLEGRRIAITPMREDPVIQERADTVRRALDDAGAQVGVLKPGQGADEDWHGGTYAALIAIGGDAATVSQPDPRLAQLIREFLVSEKPVAAVGDALDMIVQAGGAAGRSLAVPPGMKSSLEAAGGKPADGPFHTDGCLLSAAGTGDSDAFSAEVVRTFARLLEERATDEMSEQSFPASDPPSTTPASIGPAADRGTETRS